MWQVDEYAAVYLPRGYSLWEDEDFLFLYFQAKEIVVFAASGATREEIAKEIKSHQQKSRQTVIQFSQFRRTRKQSV